MVKTDIKLSNRVLALALAVLILAATFPFSAFTTFAEEVVPSTLTTDIGDKTFVPYNLYGGKPSAKPTAERLFTKIQFLTLR